MFFIAVLSMAYGSALAAEPQSGADTCAFDRSKLLSQDLATFDQSPQGWRELAFKGAACHRETADLIAEYRKLRPEVMKTNINSYLLYWHEGQTRAFMGENQQARGLFEQSRVPHIPVFKAWNIYVDATVAFLDRDRDALLNARTRLAELPPEAGKPGSKPMNLDVVDGLVRCFDRSYADAYSACRGKD
jgi:hypothetical protein